MMPLEPRQDRMPIRLCLFSLLLLVGCSNELRLDGTSDESLERSIETIRQTLTVTEQRDFDSGLAAIRTSIVDNGMTLLRGGETVVDKKFRDQLDGCTAQEIISRGRRVAAHRDKKVREMFPNLKLPDRD